ncbi:MAG: HTTM domain-containing protein [Flavobacteriales bacterium]|nr:HTTM domain-containing protein [Flavobacteriales bacterium]
MTDFFEKYLFKSVSAWPLITLRVAFGVLMTFGALRFWYYGWIEELYIKPNFHFQYFGLELPTLSEAGMYFVFMLFVLLSILFTLGFYFRIVAPLLFITFCYIELIDVSTYLNHYYFVSIVLFFFCFVPAARMFSMDALRARNSASREVPAWTINIFLLQIGIVYFFAGLAKLHSDWLLEALPLKLWLPARAHLPLIGSLLEKPIAAYIFSWAGCIYDLSIPFILLYKPTRFIGYLTVIAFHILTWILFPIGIFPWVMIVMTLAFFPPAAHAQFWRRYIPAEGTTQSEPPRNKKLVSAMVVLFFTIQILLPLRFIVQSENLFWDELGFRFSWRVMLMEKSGDVQFRVSDTCGHSYIVEPSQQLTKLQYTQMSTQPDLILQYAHHIAKLNSRDCAVTSIHAESYVSLNGRGSRPFIDPAVNLLEVTDNGDRLTWLMPY